MNFKYQWATQRIQEILLILRRYERISINRRQFIMRLSRRYPSDYARTFVGRCFHTGYIYGRRRKAFCSGGDQSVRGHGGYVVKTELLD